MTHVQRPPSQIGITLDFQKINSDLQPSIAEFGRITYILEYHDDPQLPRVPRTRYHLNQTESSE